MNPVAREAWAPWQDASPTREGLSAPCCRRDPRSPAPHSGVSRMASSRGRSRNPSGADGSVCIPPHLPATGSSSQLALPKARQAWLRARRPRARGPQSWGRLPRHRHVPQQCHRGAPLGRPVWGSALGLAALPRFRLAAAGLRVCKWKSGVGPGSPARRLLGGTQPLLVWPPAAAATGILPPPPRAPSGAGCARRPRAELPGHAPHVLPTWE